jgi:hypothetical protein
MHGNVPNQIIYDDKTNGIIVKVAVNVQIMQNITILFLKMLESTQNHLLNYKITAYTGAQHHSIHQHESKDDFSS